MSKLNRDNVGHTFEITKDKFEIQYVITNESFGHAYGYQSQYSYEVMSVKYYIDEISEFVELGDSKDLNKYIDKLIEGDL